MWPYFNSGFVAVPIHLCTKLQHAWIRISQRIRDEQLVQEIYPWLDQISLPLALAEAGLRWAVVDESYNFPLYARDGVDQTTMLVHYRNPVNCIKDRKCMDAIAQFCQQSPELWKLVRSTPAWTPVSEALQLQHCAALGACPFGRNQETSSGTETTNSAERPVGHDVAACSIVKLESDDGDIRRGFMHRTSQRIIGAVSRTLNKVHMDVFVVTSCVIGAAVLFSVSSYIKTSAQRASI